MDNSLFKKLTPAEVSNFQESAYAHYKAGEPIDPLWHPVYRLVCEQINVLAIQGDIQ